MVSADPLSAKVELYDDEEESHIYEGLPSLNDDYFFLGRIILTQKLATLSFCCLREFQPEY